MAGELYKTYEIIPGEPENCYEECEQVGCYTETVTDTVFVQDGMVCRDGQTYTSDAIYGGTGFVGGDCYPTGHYEEETRTVTRCSQSCTTVCEGGTSQERDLNLGWNAAARSIDFIKDSGAFEFRISSASVGVVVGFNDSDYGVTGYGDLPYAIYAERGAFKIVEEGTFKTGPVVFSGTDVFRIERDRGTIRYYRNGTKIRTAPRPSVEQAFLEAVLYMADDRVLEAYLAAAGRGNADLFLEPLTAYAWGDSRARADLYLQYLQGQGYDNGAITGNADLVMEPVTGFGGEGTYAEATGLHLRPITGSGWAGSHLTTGDGHANLILPSLTGSADGIETLGGGTKEQRTDWPPAGPGSLEASFRPLEGTAYTGAYAGADLTLQPVTVAANGTTYKGGLVLQPLEGVGSDYPYDHAALTLESLVSEGTGGYHLPEPVTVSLAFQPIQGSGFCLTGTIGSVDASLEPMLGLASEGVYGEGNVTLEPLTGFAFENLYPDSYAFLPVPMGGVEARGGPASSGLDAIIPFPNVEARSGGSAFGMEVPMPEATVEAAWPYVGRGVLVLPELTADGHGLTGFTGEAALTLPALTASARGAGRAAVRTQPLTVAASGKAGAIGTLEREIPVVSVDAEGEPVPTGEATLVLEPLVVHADAVPDVMEVPMPYVRAIGEPA